MAPQKQRQRRRKRTAPDQRLDAAQHQHHQARRVSEEHGRRRVPYPPLSAHPPRRNQTADVDDTGTRIMLKMVRAFLARVLFIVHSVMTISQTVDVYKNQAYWSFGLLTIVLLLEGGYAIIINAGDERRWFCPSVLLYILSTAPPIWLLELDMSKQRLLALTHNGTVPLCPYRPLQQGISVGHQLWVQLLEQFLLVVLIVGRWMLPKGEISREQLSQILLAYLAIASDIVELFDVFKEVPVTQNKHLQHMILSIWSLSLLQFPFVLTVSKARKMRVAITKSSSEEEIKRVHYRTSIGHEISKMSQICHDSDIWAIVLANCFQDIPFLLVRLYLMLGYHVITYTMIFFTCKNMLVIMLQAYRAGILLNDRYYKPTDEEDAELLTHHYRTMLVQCQDALSTLREKRRSLRIPSVDTDVEAAAAAAADESGSGSTAGGGAAHEAAAPAGGGRSPADGSRRRNQAPSKKRSPRPSPRRHSASNQAAPGRGRSRSSEQLDDDSEGGAHEAGGGGSGALLPPSYAADGEAPVRRRSPRADRQLRAEATRVNTERSPKPRSRERAEAEGSRPRRSSRPRENLRERDYRIREEGEYDDATGRGYDA